MTDDEFRERLVREVSEIRGWISFVSFCLVLLIAAILTSAIIVSTAHGQTIVSLDLTFGASMWENSYYPVRRCFCTPTGPCPNGIWLRYTSPYDPITRRGIWDVRITGTVSEIGCVNSALEVVRNGGTP